MKILKNIMLFNWFEVGLDVAFAVKKLPALDGLTRFIYDVSYGRSSQIREKTIDDAFDCVNDINKVFIKTSFLSKEDKDRAINESEINCWQQKVLFKNTCAWNERAYHPAARVGFCSARLLF